MEALCGVSAALLCAFDMLKSIEKDNEGQYHDTSIEGIRVIEKKKGNRTVE
jgi:cyclic pyranopterin phosphate synthase